MPSEQGVYPSLINWIKDQIPSSKVLFFYEWGGLARLFDLNKVDKIYHGGINKGHGSTTLNEIEIPIIMYGAGVKKGLVINKPCYIYDVPVTLAYALGITPPSAGIGRLILEAFDPNSISAPYVPMPLISPTQGFFSTSPLTVEIKVDDVDAEIF